MIGLRPVNTKSMMIPGTSHFVSNNLWLVDICPKASCQIPQDRPKDFGKHFNASVLENVLIITLSADAILLLIDNKGHAIARL